MKLIMNPRHYRNYFLMSRDESWFVARRRKPDGSYLYCCHHWRTMEARTKHFFTAGSIADFIKQFTQIAGVLFVSFYREVGEQLVEINPEDNLRKVA